MSVNDDDNDNTDIPQVEKASFEGCNDDELQQLKASKEQESKKKKSSSKRKKKNRRSTKKNRKKPVCPWDAYWQCLQLAAKKTSPIARKKQSKKKQQQATSEPKTISIVWDNPKCHYTEASQYWMDTLFTMPSSTSLLRQSSIETWNPNKDSVVGFATNKNRWESSEQQQQQCLRMNTGSSSSNISGPLFTQSPSASAAANENKTLGAKQSSLSQMMPALERLSDDSLFSISSSENIIPSASPESSSESDNNSSDNNNNNNNSSSGQGLSNINDSVLLVPFRRTSRSWTTAAMTTDGSSSTSPTMTRNEGSKMLPLVDWEEPPVLEPHHQTPHSSKKKMGMSDILAATPKTPQTANTTTTTDASPASSISPHTAMPQKPARKRSICQHPPSYQKDQAPSVATGMMHFLLEGDDENENDADDGVNDEKREAPAAAALNSSRPTLLLREFSSSTMNSDTQLIQPLRRLSVDSEASLRSFANNSNASRPIRRRSSSTIASIEEGMPLNLVAGAVVNNDPLIDWDSDLEDPEDYEQELEGNPDHFSALQKLQFFKSSSASSSTTPKSRPPFGASRRRSSSTIASIEEGAPLNLSDDLNRAPLISWDSGREEEEEEGYSKLNDSSYDDSETKTKKKAVKAVNTDGNHNDHDETKVIKFPSIHSANSSSTTNSNSSDAPLNPPSRRQSTFSAEHTFELEDYQDEDTNDNDDGSEDFDDGGQENEHLDDYDVDETVHEPLHDDQNCTGGAAAATATSTDVQMTPPTRRESCVVVTSILSPLRPSRRCSIQECHEEEDEDDYDDYSDDRSVSSFASDDNSLYSMDTFHNDDTDAQEWKLDTDMVAGLSVDEKIQTTDFTASDSTRAEDSTLVRPMRRSSILKNSSLNTSEHTSCSLDLDALFSLREEDEDEDEENEQESPSQDPLLDASTHSNTAANASQQQNTSSLPKHGPFVRHAPSHTNSFELAHRCYQKRSSIIQQAMVISEKLIHSKDGQRRKSLSMKLQKAHNMVLNSSNHSHKTRNSNNGSLSSIGSSFCGTTTSVDGKNDGLSDSTSSFDWIHEAWKEEQEKQKQKKLNANNSSKSNSISLLHTSSSSLPRALP